MNAPGKREPDGRELAGADRAGLAVATDEVVTQALSRDVALPHSRARPPS